MDASEGGYPLRENVIGYGPLDNHIACLIAHVLRSARDDGWQRSEIASAMSKYLGHTISSVTLDKWTSEGSSEHRIPLDALPGLEN